METIQRPVYLQMSDFKNAQISTWKASLKMEISENMNYLQDMSGGNMNHKPQHLDIMQRHRWRCRRAFSYSGGLPQRRNFLLTNQDRGI